MDTDWFAHKPMHIFFCGDRDNIKCINKMRVCPNSNFFRFKINIWPLPFCLFLPCAKNQHKTRWARETPNINNFTRPACYHHVIIIISTFVYTNNMSIVKRTMQNKHYYCQCHAKIRRSCGVKKWRYNGSQHAILAHSKQTQLKLFMMMMRDLNKIWCSISST